MKAFSFSLDRVLQWRRTQLELERAEAQRIAHRRALAASELQASGDQREAALRVLLRGGAVESSSMQTMSSYLSRSQRERKLLENKLAALEREAAGQTAKTLEAQRKVKLLERLRDRRYAEWLYEADAEQERFAAEAWLGKLHSKDTGAGA